MLNIGETSTLPAHRVLDLVFTQTFVNSRYAIVSVC